MIVLRIMSLFSGLCFVKSRRSCVQIGKTLFPVLSTCARPRLQITGAIKHSENKKGRRPGLRMASRSFCEPFLHSSLINMRARTSNLIPKLPKIIMIVQVRIMSLFSLDYAL